MVVRTIISLVVAFWLALCSTAAIGETVSLTAKSRDSNNGSVELGEVAFDPAHTLIVVIDMWDRHWCKTFTARSENMIPRMNASLAAARKLGFQVVMAPSDVMPFYQGAPQRTAMQAIPSHAPYKTIDFQRAAEPRGKDGCECGPHMPCSSQGVWTRQHRDLTIADDDLICDANNAAELLDLCQERKIDAVIYCGVASNMCVCDRSVGMFNMRRHGLNTYFIRDLVESITANGVDPMTGKPDATFTPAKGTQRTEQFLEANVAPSIESEQLLAAAGLDSDDPRPHVAMVIADDEYESERTLPEFAREHLDSAHRVTTLHANPQDRNDVPGLEALYDADLLILSMRRRFLPAPQMDLLERYIRSGKPMIALRVSSAAFGEGSGLARTADGQVVWQNFDEEVLGCRYNTYDPAARESGSDVWIEPTAVNDPLLQSIKTEKFHTPAWIYRVAPLQPDAQVLLSGSWNEENPAEPVAWKRADDGKYVFYTSLGHPADFENDDFVQLLKNAVSEALSHVTSTRAAALNDE